MSPVIVEMEKVCGKSLYHAPTPLYHVTSLSSDAVLYVFQT